MNSIWRDTLKQNITRLVLGILSTSLIFIASFTQAVEQSFAAADFEQILLQSKEDAEKGKVINSSFGIGTHKDEILKEYGKPDYQDEFSLNYLSSKQVSFALDNNGKVIQIFTTDKDLLEVNSEQTEKVLGPPKCAQGGFGKVYWTYQFGEYGLTFEWRNQDDARPLLSATVKKFVPEECNPVR